MPRRRPPVWSPEPAAQTYLATSAAPWPADLLELWDSELNTSTTSLEGDNMATISELRVSMNHLSTEHKQRISTLQREVISLYCLVCLLVSGLIWTGGELLGKACR